MDIASVIRYRLEELGVEQRDLALGAGVTESYISQLLAQKKTPPAPDRTDIYEKIAKVLKLPSKELTRLAETQRREELQRRVLEPPRPLFGAFRELILRKCAAGRKKQIASIFEREPFGEIERFITERLFEAVKTVAKEELEHPEWVKRVARVSRRSEETMRGLIREFLETDVFHVSIENCITLLDSSIQRWDIEMGSFSMEIELNRKLAGSRIKRFAFREVEPEREVEASLREFLNDVKLSGGISDEEIAFLKRLSIEGKRPSALYYYRELQNLRDPLNFLPSATQTPEKRSPATKAGNQRKGARGRRGSQMVR